MAKLFAVTVEVTLYVVADDAEAAETWVENNPDEWSPDIDGGITHAREVTRAPVTHTDTLPWIADIEDAPKRTVAQWFEATKAEVTP
jgi:hypothetical protein